MKFGNLFEKTISSLKKAGLVFWIMCLVVSLLGLGSEFMSMNFNIDVNDSYLSSELEIDNYFTEDELAEYFDKYNNSEEYTDDYLNELEYEYIVDDFEGTFLNHFVGAAVILIFGAIIVFLIMILIVNLISTIINYYFMAFAVESVDGEEITKGRNLGKIILAQILISLMIFIPILACIVFVVLAISLGNIILILPGVLILFFGALYLSTRYSAIYYVAVKYQDFTAREILKKSSEITSGNILKIILYIMLNALIFGFIIGLPVSFGTSLLISLSPVVGLIVYFVISLIINTVTTAFMVMFNVNMYKELDCKM